MKRKTDPATSSPTAAFDPGTFEAAPADMRLLVRAVELGTLSAAARERDVPVSMVSRAIDRLEAVYRARLLQRSTHGISVTPEGEIFLAFARQILGSFGDLAGELASRAARPSGLVRISASPLMAEMQLIPSLAKLLAPNPELRIEVLSEDRMTDLATEGIDLAVRTSQVDNENLVARQVGEHRRAIYASPSYIARFGEPLEPEDLHHHRCITHSSATHLNRWRFQRAGRDVDISVSGFHRSSSTGHLISLVRAGLGVCRLHTAFAAPGVASGELIPVLEKYRDVRRFPVYVVMLPDRHRLPKIRVVIEHLSRVFGSDGLN